jgi:hypothetical protein
MAKATEEVLEDAGIAPNRRGSRDMLKVWNKGVTPRSASAAEQEPSAKVKNVKR